MEVDPRLIHQDVQTGKVCVARAVPAWEQTLPVPPPNVIPTESLAEQVSKHEEKTCQ